MEGLRSFSRGALREAGWLGGVRFGTLWARALPYQLVAAARRMFCGAWDSLP
jgi:hypothetical protein